MFVAMARGGPLDPAEGSGVGMMIEAKMWVVVYQIKT